MRIAFIGAGIMGTAMLKRILAEGVAEPPDIVVSDVRTSQRESLSKQYGVEAVTSNRRAIEGVDIAILAMKPQELAEVMEELKDASPEHAVLSIVAGASLATLCQGFNHDRVIRAMPNMPAQIGEGVAVWVAAAGVGPKQKEMAKSILRALGEEIYVSDEKYLDMATALSGSGPAYVFLFIEALIDAGVHIGLSRDMAQKLVVQTVLGSTRVVSETGKHTAELRDMVTSPGGTTTEALFQLEKGGLRSLLLEAVAAAYEKAKRL
jgi:pyrroline-5-carboxylate reductase